MAGDAVRGQYEAYPYPPRDPAAEKTRLVTGSPSHIDEIDHYVFGGRLHVRFPMRALVAGGGTGDGAIMLAQQLALSSPSSEVVYTDISAASLDIARDRARMRNLRNIRFERLSITDLPTNDLGLFDYIDCCGVLHHLDDPRNGLQHLADALAAEGGMGLMVYGELGRIGVYHVQEMMRLLGREEAEVDSARLGRVKRLLSRLPATNWLRRNPFIRDHLEQGDTGLYDLFLHAKDRAFGVQEIAPLVAAAGLRIVTFIEPAFYEPATYLGSAMAQELDRLPWIDRCRFAELLAGNMRKHVFYVVRDSNPVTPPDAADPRVVPILRDVDGAALAQTCEPGAALTASRDGLSLRRPLPDLAASLLERIDGRKSVGELHEDLQRTHPAVEWDRFAREFGTLYVALNGIGKLYLSYRGARPDRVPSR